MSSNGLWRPSNATEGDLWVEAWCATCVNGEGIEDPDVVDVCPIYVELLFGNSDRVRRLPHVFEAPAGMCIDYQAHPEP